MEKRIRRNLCVIGWLLCAAAVCPPGSAYAATEQSAKAEKTLKKAEQTPSAATTDQVVKSTSESAALAIAAARQHAAGIETLANANREYYDALSKYIAGIAAVLLFVLGFLGFTERKQRADLEKEIRKQLKQMDEAKHHMGDLERQLQNNIQDAAKTGEMINERLAAIRQQEIKANVWILDVNRGMNALLYSTFTSEPNAKQIYLKIAREILEKIAADETMANSIRAYGYRHLAGLYKSAKRYSDAWKAIQRALELTVEKRDAVLLYNAACYASVNGLSDIALSHLAGTLEADPDMKEIARGDPDFDNLRGDARFQALVSPPNKG